MVYKLSKKDYSRWIRKRDRAIVETPNWTWIVRGTLSSHRFACGKPQCRCHRSKKYHHGPYWYVGLSDQGRKKRFLIPASQVARIRRGIAAYERLWQLLCRISEINLLLIRGGNGNAKSGGGK